MPIVKDINTMMNELARPENKELADLIKKEVHYAVTARPRASNEEYLTTVISYNLLKIFKEYPMMIDGRNNNNDQPF